jgi:plastocyanin
MRRRTWLTYALLLIGSMPLLQGHAETTVHGQISFNYTKDSSRQTHNMRPSAVIWLMPISPAEDHWTSLVHPDSFKLEQKNKEFIPHLLVIPKDSTVNFPNLDPYFHNVFSLFNGKRFDLGLYEKGQSRAVRFDRLGVSYIFCDIHPEMSAVVITLDTPYFAVASSGGSVTIASVPPGEYDFKVWAEGVSEAQLTSLAHRIKITSKDTDLGVISLLENSVPTHKNKFGEDYWKQTTPPY